MGNFDPVDFYRQAGAWYAAPGTQSEATYRSVVSRAYYASILAAREKARIGNSGETTHKATVEYYLSRSDRLNLSIGNRLNDLRRHRNDADYDVAQTCVPKNAGEALRKSERILQDLGRLPSSGG